MHDCCSHCHEIKCQHKMIASTIWSQRSIHCSGFLDREESAKWKCSRLESLESRCWFEAAPRRWNSKQTGERVEASVCSDLGMNNAVAVWSTKPLVNFEIGKDFEWELFGLCFCQSHLFDIGIVASWNCQRYIDWSFALSLDHCFWMFYKIKSFWPNARFLFTLSWNRMST